MKPVRPDKIAPVSAPRRLTEKPGGEADGMGFSGQHRPAPDTPVFTLSHHDCVTRTDENTASGWAAAEAYFLRSKNTFAGIGEEFAGYDRANILLQSIPYDGTSTWGKGANRGFEAFLEAAANMELYDIETDTEVYPRGIHILPEITENHSPEAVYHATKAKTAELLHTGKFLTFFGGEHSISIGIIEAFAEHMPGLTVLQLDAHADLRPSYQGSEFNHACAMHRASQQTNLVQVGIRSMDASEKQWVDRERCFFAQAMQENDSWMDRSISLMGEHVYLSIDLDVLDPSMMPSTGTPEPGGMKWYSLLAYLKKVFEEKEVVGFDLVEFAPIPSLKAPDFLVAKLYYKLLTYKYQKLP